MGNREPEADKCGQRGGGRKFGENEADDDVAGEGFVRKIGSFAETFAANLEVMSDNATIFGV